MNIIIIYATKHGSTGKIVDIIKDKLIEHEVTIINLNREEAPEPSQYDRILIGGSVYMGRLQKKTSQFLQKHHDKLLNKEIGLFLCGMTEDEKEIEELIKRVFPEDLLEHARAADLLGGEFLLDKLNFFERFIVKKVGKVTQSQSKINNEKIEGFVKIIL